MGSREHSGISLRLLSRARLQRVAVLVLASLLALGGVVNAGPDYKELKAEIKKLEKTVDDARKARNDADAKLAENRRAQSTANGQQLANLKKAAVDLARTAGDKADELASAQQDLANKQGELRETAAAHAVKQINDAAGIEKRVGEAQIAIDDWQAALSTLPDVPSLRPLDGFDPDDQPAVRKQDKKALDAFDKWAASEETRIEQELKQAQQVLDAKSKWNSSKDGGDDLVEDAKALKETLDSRKKSVGELRKIAKARLKQIK